MTKQSATEPEVMKKHPYVIPSLAQSEAHPDEFSFVQWNQKQLLNWLKGIDESISPYLRLFTQNQLNGSFLDGLTDEQLRRLGITKEPTRRLIQQALHLLSYYAYEIKTENAQKLALKVVISVQDMANIIGLATPIINSPTQSSRSLVVLNSVLMSVSEIHERVTKLIFCLDRHPFDNKKEFVHIRNELANFMKEMIEAINPNNKRFFAVPQLLVHLGQKIQQVARELIRSSDPYIIETPYIQRAVLYGQPNDWGMEFRLTSEGIFLITSIDPESPNFTMQRINVGDEIVEINRQTVIGWKYSNVLKKMEMMAREGSHGYELEITLCKRPRDCINLALQKPPRSPSAERRREDQKKMVLEFKHKIQPELFSRQSSKNNTERGVQRSASFPDEKDLRKHISFEEERVRNEPLYSINLPPSSLTILNDKKPLFRRASVWSESPPSIIRSPFDRLHAAESNAWLLLLASWGEVGKNRHNGYIHGRPIPRLPLQDNSNIIKEEMYSESEYEDVMVDELSVRLATNTELETMNIKTPIVDDDEWSTPANEDITGCKIVIRDHLERGLSVSNVIDSPLSNIHAKITKFWYGTDGGGGVDAEQQQHNNSISISTSFSEKVEGIPITPKIAQDLIFFTPSSKIQQQQQQQQFSPTQTVDSPNSMSRSISPQSPHSHTPLSRVMNIVTKRIRLAPLAEPDDDLDENERIDLPKKSISNDDMFGYIQNLLEKCARIPVNDLVNKLHEGWVRRQRIMDDDLRTIVKRNSQWVKCWLVLTRTNLFVYSNQNSKEADIVFDLKRVSLTTDIQLKTSKQNTFEVVWNNGRLCFAPWSSIDSTRWIRWLSEHCAAAGQEKTSQLNPIYVRSVDPDSTSSNASGTRPTGHLNPSRIFSRFSRRSFSGPNYYTTIGSGAPSSPMSSSISQGVVTN